MIDYYTVIKLTHISCVLISGGIFAIRGSLMLLRSPWANHAAFKYSSYFNDSILLVAGLLLMQITQQYPGSQAWLSVKLGLLLIYITLGIFALRRAPSYRARTMCLIAALSVYLFMFSVARTHLPLGYFHAL